MKIIPWRIVAAVLLAFAGASLLVVIAKSNNAGQRDFISYWAAGHQLIHHANPYDAGAVQELERSAGYKLSYRLIMRNPPEALFLALPLGFAGPNTGLVLWMMALLACLVASIRMIWAQHGRPAGSLHLLGYCFAPVMECLMAGQLGIFLLFGFVLFLYLNKSRPFFAGAALVLCAAKPHLFLPFGIALLLWIAHRKSYRILAGFCVALSAVCGLALWFDTHAWPDYSQMMRSSGVFGEIAPALSELLRLLVYKDAIWLQFLPLAAACCWVIWFYRTRRERWSWMDQGLLVLLVSVMCAPYALLTDEAVLLPAILAGIYRADRSGRSLLPFGLVAGVAMLEVFTEVPMTTMFYLWTTPAWLAWYLYATGKCREGEPEILSVD